MCTVRLFPDAWRSVTLFVTPATVLDWHRRRYKDFWTFVTSFRKRGGRPCIPEHVKEFIGRLARDNPSWQPRRIQGEVFRVLGERLHIDTVRKYRPKRNPDPRRVLSWATFLKLHCPSISAMDFFAIPRIGKNPLFGFFVIQHERRKLLCLNVTERPTADWIREQLIQAFVGQPHILRFLISDNDVLFQPVREFIEGTLDLVSLCTQIASPWQNGIAERFVRTVREELLQFMLPLSETVVRQRLLEYMAYYNQHRTHASVDLDSPEGRETGPPPGNNVRLLRKPVLGGLHSTYHWEAA